VQPDFYVKLSDANGQDITDKVRPHILSLSVTDNAGIESDSATLSLDNAGQKIDPPRTGVKLDIGLGYQEMGLVSFGVYVVDEVRLQGKPDTIEITAKAANFTDTFKSQKTRSFDNRTIQEIVEIIAKEEKLKPLVGEELRQVKIAHIDQTNESNMHFITRMAAQYDAVGKPVGGVLAVEKHGQAKSRTGKSPQDIPITINTCTRWSANIKDQPRYSRVVARYYDKDKATYVEKSSGSGDGPSQTLKKTYPTEKEAQDAADSAMKGINRTTGDVSLTLVGDPRLRAEYYVQLRNFHPLIDKRWLIKTATHTISAQGYTTELSCESESETQKSNSGGGSNGRGKPPTPATMTLEQMQQQIDSTKSGGKSL
jgi:hypothetical protein